MTRNEAIDYTRKMGSEGWTFFLVGKKPFHSYLAKKDDVAITGSSRTVLAEKMQAHHDLNTKIDQAEADLAGLTSEIAVP